MGHGRTVCRMLADEPYLSIPEAAAALHVSERSVRRWVRSGKLAVRPLPSGRVQIPKAEVEKWLEVVPAGSGSAA